MDYTSLTPVSKIQVSHPMQPQSLDHPQQPQQPPRPLDRPTLVRPQRTSTVLIHQNSANSPTLDNLQQHFNNHPQPQYLPNLPYMEPKKLPEEPPEKERIEVIPMNLEKPTGLDMSDFLPMKVNFKNLNSRI